MKAIDIHGHFGICDNNDFNRVDQMMSAGIDIVVKRARKINIKITIVSALESLMPYGGNIINGNKSAYEAAEKYPDVKFWAVLNPKLSNYDQIQEYIKLDNCWGIKIHPTLHNYTIEQYGNEIFEYVDQLPKKIILAHCAPPFAAAETLLPFINNKKYQDVQLILAHLGGGGKTVRQTNVIKQSKFKNVYTDTSSASSINSGLIEWAVTEIGSENILFGTDTPLYFASCQKIRIEHAEIESKHKENILFKNAEKLLGISL